MIRRIRSTLSPRSILADARQRRVATAVALVALALLGAVAATGTAAAQSDQPTVVVTDATATADGTATVGIVLTNAPNGLAGYYLDITVETPGTARIQSASYPDRFGLTTEPEISSDGATATLEAADMEGAIEPGATNVTLATVELAGAEPGETALSVTPRQFDADTGNAFEPATQPGTVTVSDGATTPAADAGSTDASNGGQPSQSDAATADGTDAGPTDTPAPTSGFGTFPTLLVVVAIALLLGGARWRQR